LKEQSNSKGTQVKGGAARKYKLVINVNVQKGRREERRTYGKKRSHENKHLFLFLSFGYR